MKKTLIALAVLAVSGAAVAQSSVTLSGVMDFAVGNVKVGNQAAETTVSTRDLTSATSVIRITAVEDLGGGLKATALYALDPRHLANDSAGGSAAAPGLQRDEAFIGLEGGFGNLRLGSANSVGLTTFLTASPLGTGIGSGYAATALDYSFIRHSRSIRYDSPNLNGFRVAVNYAPGASEVAGPVFGSINAIPQGSEVTELGLSYANGPLTVAFANIALGARAASATGPVAAAAKASTNVLAVRYTMGATAISAGWNDGDSAARSATPVATKGYRVGIAQTMGAVTLIGSYAEQETPTVTEKVTGLRADYALSKRTAAYVGYEKANSGLAYTAATTAAATGGNRTTMAVGVRHSF
jgi:predicted porin